MPEPCPLCAEDGHDRPAAEEYDYDDVGLCVFHALSAQSDEGDTRKRVAAAKAATEPRFRFTVSVPAADREVWRRWLDGLANGAPLHTATSWPPSTDCGPPGVRD
jgi:hypothetical protein